MEAGTATKWVYDFAEGSRDLRALLGGKGANVAEMTRILGQDRVPAGFTITTAACVAYMAKGGVQERSPRGITAHDAVEGDEHRDGHFGGHGHEVRMNELHRACSTEAFSLLPGDAVVRR